MEKDNLQTLRHSTSHLLAMAVLELYPQAKLAIGPAISDGFYYDFDLEKSLTPEDLPKIEAKMTEIIKKDLPFEKKELTKDQAKKLFGKLDQPYKLELIEEIPAEKVTTYKTGDFTDLCEGPHVNSTKEIKAFKLTKIAGAYWRGDEKNKMLQRIYGTAFESQKELDEYLENLAKVEEIDHRKLGERLKLFFFDEAIGPGLAIWLPKGEKILEILKNYIRQKLECDYQFVFTPHIGNINLWRTSGHVEHYKDYMFSPLGKDKSSYLIKPMNCPFHIKIFSQDMRSYRDLPLRLAEFATVYREEKGGVLHGLLRVRSITQDDGHIFCTEDQIEGEIVKVLELAKGVLGDFAFSDLEYCVSTKPPKSLGTLDQWQKIVKILYSALDKMKIEYQTEAGEGAFYGPKIDIKAKDALGRRWQLTTIQVDFNLPERFDIAYIDEKGKKQRPIIIHRAIFGALERFMAILLEHYKGILPLWLAPEQIRVIPVGTEERKPAEDLEKELIKLGFRATADLHRETIPYKIRQGELDKINYMFIIGKREIGKSGKAEKVAVRSGSKDLGPQKLDEVIAKLQKEIKNKA